MAGSSGAQVSDQSWYSQLMSGDNTDANPFANPALRLTPNNEMLAFLAKPGNTMILWLKHKEALNAQ